MQQQPDHEELLAKRLAASQEVREGILEAWKLRNPNSSIGEHPEFEEFLSTAIDVSLASSIAGAKHTTVQALMHMAGHFDYLHAYPGHIIQGALASFAQQIANTERTL